MSSKDVNKIAVERRQFLQKSGAMISLSIASAAGLLTPVEAAKRNLPYQLLSQDEAALLGSFGEFIVPGSRKSGMVYFIDDQLAQDPNECMLLLKYFQVRPPYAGFYQAGCAALRNYSKDQFGERFEDLKPKQKDEIVQALIGGKAKNWQGPPAFLFYMFVRSDGVDTLYGTPQGFEKLGVPYMAHILPPQGWSND